MATRSGNWQKAETYCRLAADYEPDSVTPRLILAKVVYLGQGRYEDALRVLQDLIEDHPNSHLAHDALGLTHQAQGQLSDARAGFLVAQRLNPNWPPVYLNAGRVFILLGELERAEDQLRQGLKLVPGWLDAELALAEVLNFQGRAGETLSLYENMYRRYPNHPLVISNLAYLYAERGSNLSVALKLAQRLVRSRPNHSTYLDTLGWVYYQMERYEEAIQHLQQATGLDPGKGTFHYHLGKALLAAGREAEAREVLQQTHGLELPAELEEEIREILTSQ